MWQSRKGGKTRREMTLKIKQDKNNSTATHLRYGAIIKLRKRRRKNTKNKKKKKEKHTFTLAHKPSDRKRNINNYSQIVPAAISSKMKRYI